MKSWLNRTKKESPKTPGCYDTFRYEGYDVVVGVGKLGDLSKGEPSSIAIYFSQAQDAGQQRIMPAPAVFRNVVEHLNRNNCEVMNPGDAPPYENAAQFKIEVAVSKGIPFDLIRDAVERTVLKGFEPEHDTLQAFVEIAKKPAEVARHGGGVVWPVTSAGDGYPRAPKR